MRGNGERIGPQNLPTSSVAGGVWNLINQQRAQQRGAWPSATPPVTTDPYFMYVPLLLNTTSTNAQQNNTFLDSSTNNFTITRNGTPTQGSFTPYQPSGYWSNYLNQSSAYLTFPLVTLGSTFTAEGWFYPTNPSASVSIIASNFVQDTGTNWIGYYSTKLTFSYAGIVRDFATTITANTWYHFAFVVTGSTVTCYLNGTQIGTTQSAPTSFTLDTISRYGSSGIVGYLSNFRVVNGVAVYTGTFTPSTSPLQKTQSSGTNISAITGSQTSLLTCQSNRFIDNSNGAIAITPSGTPLVQAFQPFSPAASYSAATYGGSGYVNQSSAYLTFPLITLGSTFTVEGWFYATTITAGSNIFVSNRAQDGGTKWLGFINSDRFVFSYGGTNREFLTTINLNTWYHFAFVITSSTVTCYSNGTQVGSTQAAPTSLTLDTISGYGTAGMIGYLSNFRIVNGTAVYTGNFTPPTLAPLQTAGSTSAASYPSTTNVNTSFAAANTSLLTNFTNAGIYDAAWQNNALTVGDAQVSTTQAQFPTTSMKFDGTGDNLNIASNQGLNLGTGSFTIEAWVYLNAMSGDYFVTSSTGNGGGFFGFRSGTDIGYGRTGIAWDYQTASGMVVNNWYHVAWARNGTSLRIFVNGSQVGTTQTTSQAFDLTTTSTAIGSAGGSFYLNGYMQDVRITKGLARYTANFSVPTAAFPTR